VDEIIRVGGKLRTASRWLNAASFKVAPELLERIYNLHFVYNIKPVAVDIQKITDLKEIEKNTESPQQSDTSSYRDFYNLTYDQNYMLGIPQVYYKGFTGSGVKLAILDTGLKRKHIALRSIRIHKEHDFLGGDNFYIKKTNGVIDSIPNLTNLSMVKSPQLFKTASNRLFIFFSADTFAPGQTNPCRLISSYSNDLGQTWSNPRSIFNTATYNMSIPNLSVAGKDSVVYLIWQDLLPQAPNAPITNLYLGHIINTTQAVNINLGNGKNPHLSAKENGLYITYINQDSVLYFRKADISNISPSLYPARVVNAFAEPITNPIVIVDSLGEIEIFVQGLRTTNLYHFTSSDNGETFQEKPNIDNVVSNAQAKITGNTIYLMYKDYDVSPGITRLSLRKSTDGGNTWLDKNTVVNNLLSLGSYSFMVNDSIYVSYETQSNIYLTKSHDLSSTWTTPVKIGNDFQYHPNLIALNNQPLITWIRRGDSNTDYEEGKDFFEQPNHGTHMASIIAGYLPKAFVGAAPGVDLIIAKTELHKAISGYTYETITEEDIWVQGLEWAEREGAQIISSSLGYRSWYTYKDYDGKTIPVSVAAGLAAKRGVIVVSAMGNAPLSHFPWPSQYIVAPGDANGIITAGGVNLLKRPWIGTNSATGIGPTYDGRIKPDLSALADAVTIVNSDDSTAYLASSGTSCATALIAGCCAVLLEAHPNWNADSVKNALFATASLNTPNCTLGWGIPNIDSVLKIYPTQIPTFQKNQLADPYPVPYRFNEAQKIYFPIYLIQSPRWAELRIYSLHGELIKTLPLDFSLISVPGRYQDQINLERIGAVWDGKNANNRPVSSGLYIAVLETSYGRDIKKFAVVR
ncbi:MAG: S8 family serine peptidase, partial [Candidatus Latescibacteria bacterium]|nr:S8 family serine peptidase [Candidatus Latescibacterota bacterium]